MLCFMALENKTVVLLLTIKTELALIDLETQGHGKDMFSTTNLLIRTLLGWVISASSQEAIL